MPSDPVIDIPQLLQPISEAAPSGEELTSLTPSFDAAKTAFQDSRTSERESRERAITGASEDEDLPPIDPPRWSDIKEKCLEILAQESKDLRVASWLIEALLRIDGVPGLRDGLQLFDQLCRTYWDTIHPAPTEEDGHQDTVAQFDGMASDASLTPLYELLITKTGTGEDYTYLNYLDAAELDTVADASVREQRIQDGAATFAQLEDAVRNSPSEFYINLIDDLLQIDSSLSSIAEFLDEHCQPNDANEYTSPSVSYYRGAIADMRQSLASVARFHLQSEEEAAEGEVEGGSLISADGGQRMSNGAVVSRDDAFEVLRKVADFFERTEPHSPVSYALRQVVVWGKMSLPELLAELIKDSSVLQDVAKRIGVELPPEEY